MDMSRLPHSTQHKSQFVRRSKTEKNIVNANHQQLHGFWCYSESKVKKQKFSVAFSST